MRDSARVERRPSSLGVTIDGYAVEGGYDTEGGPATSFGVAQALGRIRTVAAVRRAPSSTSTSSSRAPRQLGCRRAPAHAGVGAARASARRARRDGARALRRERCAPQAGGVDVDRSSCCATRRWPSWLGQEPWLSAWAPLRFAAHAAWVGAAARRARACASSRSARPTPRRAAGWSTGVAPAVPSRAAADAASALDGMLVAHQLAVEALADARAVDRVGRSCFEASHAPTTTARSGATSRAGVDGPGALARDASAWRRPRRATACVPRHVDARGRDASRSVRSRCARRGGGRRRRRSSGGSAATTSSCSRSRSQHAEGEVATVELGAGSLGWDSQLGATLPRSARSTAPCARCTCTGSSSSTGPARRHPRPRRRRPARRRLALGVHRRGARASARPRRDGRSRYGGRRSAGPVAPSASTRRRRRARSGARPRIENATARATTSAATPIAA